jgi:hypothetical protein
MLKSPVTKSSEGEVTRPSRSEEKSDRKLDKEEDGGR